MTTLYWLGEAWLLYAAVLGAMGIVPFYESWLGAVYVLWGTAFLLVVLGFRRAQWGAYRATLAHERSTGDATPFPAWLWVLGAMVFLANLFVRVLIWHMALLPALLVTVGIGSVVLMAALIRRRIARRRRARDYPIII